MELTAAGDLVNVATGGPQIDGIVVEMLSGSKVAVAVMDRAGRPVLRTVQRTALTERAEAGPDDRALHLLVRRTPAATRGAAPAGAAAGHGRAGHGRAAMHRTTGK